MPQSLDFSASQPPRANWNQRSIKEIASRMSQNFLKGEIQWELSTDALPFLMKLFMELARLVTLALHPRPTMRAVRTALLPPVNQWRISKQPSHENMRVSLPFLPMMKVTLGPKLIVSMEWHIKFFNTIFSTMPHSASSCEYELLSQKARGINSAGVTHWSI